MPPLSIENDTGQLAFSSGRFFRRRPDVQMLPSTRWPAHLAVAEDVDVEVWHRFAGVGAVVDDQPVAARLQPRFFSDNCGREQQMAEELLVVGLGLGNA